MSSTIPSSRPGWGPPSSSGAPGSTPPGSPREPGPELVLLVELSWKRLLPGKPLLPGVWPPGWNWPPPGKPRPPGPLSLVAPAGMAAAAPIAPIEENPMARAAAIAVFLPDQTGGVTAGAEAGGWAVGRGLAGAGPVGATEAAARSCCPIGR